MTTTIRTQTWEHNLLSLAYEHSPSQPASHRGPLADANTLDEAYDYCSALTAQHSHSFYLASSLLPGEKRRAMRALYAFCRVSDNIVDQPGGEPLKQLAAWERRALSPNPSTSDPVALAWADTRRRFHIPNHYAVQLLQGVRRDLIQTRYATFTDLATYAYGVASTVGLMSMHIIGFSSQEAIPYAIKLGVALQLTNILRDVAEDWRAGRVYLPAVELADFELDESDLAAGRVDARWRDFMAFQVERNRHLYAEALPGLAFLSPDGRFAVAAAGELYRAILDDIEAHDYDVFSRRAHQGPWGKLCRLPGIWWRSRTARIQPARPRLQVEPAA
jgi:phytoene synthase